MVSTIMDLVRANDVEFSPLIVCGIVAGVVFACWQFLFTGLDPREPPEVRCSIPFGHLFGMLWYKAEYVTVLR
jgi:hypothetical protein